MSDFKITTAPAKTFRTFIYSQLFCTPPYPTHDFSGQTIVVTGSNTGLGLEAARHFYRLGAGKVIMAVRTVSKGEAAKEDIVKSVTARTDAAAIEVWQLDLSSTSSTISFAEKAAKLDRLDIVVENAGINNAMKWSESEGVEATIQINVLNTLLLGLLLYPALKVTGEKYNSTPHLTIVSSEVHRFTTFPDYDPQEMYAKLNDKETFRWSDRYNVSKLLEILFVRELVNKLPAPSETSPHVPVITLVNPGLCSTTLGDEAAGALKFIGTVMRFLIGRTVESGSRTLVAGACAGQASHGWFMSDSANQEVEDWIYTDGGKTVQKNVFDQTMRALEERRPGVGKSVGL